MALSKQEVIEKILSFNYEELADWIRLRLQGDDKHFPIYEGYETNLSKFLAEAFYHIKDEKFRENFLEILHDLTIELWGCTKNRELIKEKQEYIYELLSLCGRIDGFKRKSILYRIARSGKLKGFKVFNKDLHLMLLRALASYRVTGDYEFWVYQMKDDSNKYYANAAFYALLNRKYALGVLFEHIDIFIDRFKGEIALVLGIKALVNDYDPREIIERFKGIESKLTPGQRKAVNHVFSKLKYTEPYKIDPGVKEKAVYRPLKPAVSMVGERKVIYGDEDSMQNKAAGILKSMGFEVEPSLKIAGYSIDIFIKKKKMFGNKYECYICKCWDEEAKINKNEVRQFAIVRNAVRNELNKQKGFDGCDAIIFSLKGFTKGAVETAAHHGIILKSLEELEADLR
jgi:hypothetical protein